MNSSSFLSTVVYNAVSNLQEISSNEQVLLSNKGFTSISCTKGDRPRIYWVNVIDGTMGSFSPTTGKLRVVLRNLKRPVKIMVKDRSIYFIELGDKSGHGSRVCSFDRGSLRLTILWEGMGLLPGLHIASNHDVYFLRKYPSSPSTDNRSNVNNKVKLKELMKPGSILFSNFVSNDNDLPSEKQTTKINNMKNIPTEETTNRFSRSERQAQVCLIPGAVVIKAIPGPNIWIKDHLLVLLTRSHVRSGRPCDLTISIDGHLLLAIEEGSLGGQSRGGFIEVYSKLRAQGNASFTNDGLRVWRRLNKIRDLFVTKTGDIFYTGNGAPIHGHETAIGFSRIHGMGRFKIARKGSAICATTDREGNVFFCPGMGKVGSSLNVLWGGCFAVKPKTQISSKLSTGKLKKLKVETVNKPHFHDTDTNVSVSPTNDKGMIHSDTKISNRNEQREFALNIYRRMSKKLSLMMNRPSNLLIKQVDTSALQVDPRLASPGTLVKAVAKSKKVKVNVVLRCRPLFPSEEDAGAKSILNIGRNQVVVLPYNTYQSPKSYQFGSVFGPESTQKEVFESTMVPAVVKALDGYNCTVFAYGQTGENSNFS